MLSDPSSPERRHFVAPATPASALEVARGPMPGLALIHHTVAWRPDDRIKVRLGGALQSGALQAQITLVVGLVELAARRAAAGQPLAFDPSTVVGGHAPGQNRAVPDSDGQLVALLGPGTLLGLDAPAQEQLLALSDATRWPVATNGAAAVNLGLAHLRGTPETEPASWAVPALRSASEDANGVAARAEMKITGAELEVLLSDPAEVMRWLERDGK